MKDILREILQDIAEHVSEDRQKIEVAELDDELLQKLAAMKKEKRRLKDEVSLKVKELELRVNRELEEIMEPFEEKKTEIHNSFWNELYEKKGLDPDLDYTVNAKAKKVYQYVDMKKSNERGWLM